jgi:hypothetical protein
MAEIRTLTTLTKKRAEIERAILAYERKVAESRTDLAHIKATMATFAGGGEPGMHRVYVDLLRVFEYREISTLCVKALADGEQTTRELAERLLAAKGLDVADRVLIRTMCLSVIQSMRGMERRGKVKFGGKRGTLCVWALPV